MDGRRERGPGDDSVRGVLLLAAALVSASFLLQGYIGLYFRVPWPSRAI